MRIPTTILLTLIAIMPKHSSPPVMMNRNIPTQYMATSARYATSSTPDTVFQGEGSRLGKDHQSLSGTDHSGDKQHGTVLHLRCNARRFVKDGHVNLTSRYNTSYYRKWWSDYPQDFNLRTIEENYLEFNWLTTSGIMYKQLPGEIAYIYYPSFFYIISETSLDYILAILHKSRGLIIDIRNNGGGALTNIKTLVGRLISEKITGGYIMHKTGPGHEDFSKPFPIEYEPAEDWHVKWDGPVVLLTNRSCFSAANDFTAVMKSLPNVTVVGARTGGGGGLPFSSELPNGWGVRFSACPLLDSSMQCTEFGIDPTEGYEVHASDEEPGSRERCHSGSCHRNAERSPSSRR